MSVAKTFPIKVVAKRTGLTPHVIRSWENRHQAIKPRRSAGNQRVYSENDVKRLQILKHATEAGFPIGQVANLSEAGLESLMKEVTLESGPRTPPAPTASTSPSQAWDPGQAVEEALAAIQSFDSHALEMLLYRASLTWGTQGLLVNVIIPMTEKVGELRSEGNLKVAHEHFASGIIRSFLAALHRPYAPMKSAPRIVLATPSGQLHELGAVIAAAAATSLGWEVVFLGASLPTAEIAGAATANNARAVGLSIIYPPDDPMLPGELILLRRHLPDDVALLIGGRAAPAYRKTIETIGAVLCEDLYELQRNLNRLREIPHPPPTS